MKRLYRDKSNEMIAGVCSGIAEYLDIDPTVVRLLFVLFTFVGGGGLIVYLVLWIIMPERPESTDVVVEVKEKPATPKKVAEKKEEPAAKKAPAKKPATSKTTPKKPAAPKKTTASKSTTQKTTAKKEATGTPKKADASEPETDKK